MMPVVRIDDDVYRAIQEKAIPLEDTVNSVLRRILGLNAAKRKADGKPGGSHHDSDQTPQQEFSAPILQALADLGGKAKVADVYDRVEKIMKKRLRQGDYRKVTGNEIRWRNAARFVRLRLQREGLLKSDSLRGHWEITDKGRVYLQQA